MLFFASVMLQFPAIAFINHLLAREEWARERLAPFAGKRIRVIVAPLPALVFAVGEGGMLDSSGDGPPDLTVTLSLAALPALLRRDERALQTVHFTGDADLGMALQFLFRHLRWEVEEDLSRIVGDVAAHRIVSAGRAFFAWQDDATERFGQNVGEYLTEEAAILAPPGELTRFSREVAELRDAVERLEKRLERIAAPRTERSGPR